MRLKDMPKLPLLMIAVMFVIAAVVYPRLPARVPVHWGATGAIDRWADKSFASVFGQPLIALGIYALFLLMPYFDPKRANLLKSKSVYNLLLDLVTGLFLVLFVAGLFAAFDATFPVDRIVTLSLGVLFVALGNQLGRVRQNWTMGARWGWTLSDETVWKRTNRLTGWLFVLAGLLAVTGAFLPFPLNMALLLGPMLVILPVAYVYSMVLYKRLHPDGADGAGT